MLSSFLNINFIIFKDIIESLVKNINHLFGFIGKLYLFSKKYKAFVKCNNSKGLFAIDIFKKNVLFKYIDFYYVF